MEQKRGEKKQNFKKDGDGGGGQAGVGSRGGYLKKGGGEGLESPYELCLQIFLIFQ